LIELLGDIDGTLKSVLLYDCLKTISGSRNPDVRSE